MAPTKQNKKTLQNNCKMHSNICGTISIMHMNHFNRSSEVEVVFDVFDLLHGVTNLLSLLSEDILNDRLLLGVQ